MSKKNKSTTFVDGGEILDLEDMQASFKSNAMGLAHGAPAGSTVKPRLIDRFLGRRTAALLWSNNSHFNL